MDRLLSAVGPVDRSKSTRARARVYGQAAPRPAYLNLHVKSRCRAFKKTRSSAHVHTQVRRKRRERSLAAVQPAASRPVRLAKDRLAMDRSVSPKTGGRTGPSRPRPAGGPAHLSRDRSKRPALLGRCMVR